MKSNPFTCLSFQRKTFISGNISNYRTFIYYFLTLLILSSHMCSAYYVNQFAVHIKGGSVTKANNLAKEFGFINHGQIGTLNEHYLFEHHDVRKRSADPSLHHHSLLFEHPEVHWVEQQYVHKRTKRDLTFNDPEYKNQWYLHEGGKRGTAGTVGYDMNVKRAWEMGYTGKGVVVTILDDGIERDHPDLIKNYDPYASYDVNNKDSDPMPRYDPTNENRHGTRCAGEVSASANNSNCVVGVAFNSGIGGVRMLDGEVFDAVEATSLSFNKTHIDIYSASWGPDDDGKVVDGPGRLAWKAFEDGIKYGRGGKGSIFVWASGNGGSAMDSCNCDGYTNSIFTLSISSTSEHGTRPWYLEECASTLATTYSSGAYHERQIVTTDLRKRCTSTHTGTSASAPLAAGLVALMLEANPGLTWRDVQYITLLTSITEPFQDGDWLINAKNRKVSLKYGYGLMNATGMVDYALRWTNVPEKHICTMNSPKINVQITNAHYEDSITTDGCKGSSNEVNYLEHVQVKITLNFHRRGNAVIHITSPSGTKSTILPQRPNDIMKGGFRDWAFLSVQFWEENPSGTWKLEIDDHRSNSAWEANSPLLKGTLTSWSLVLHGTKSNPINLKSDVGRSTPPTTPVMSTIPPKNCHEECLGSCTGTGPEDCLACKHVKLESSGTCLLTCPTGTREFQSVCLQCDANCESCSTVFNKELCMKCKDGYLMIEGENRCLTSCPEGYFRDNPSVAVCMKCSSTCATCIVTEDMCTRCPVGMILNNNTCKMPKVICNSGEYKDSNNHCHKCLPGCVECTSGDFCTECQHKWIMYNNKCLESCLSGYLQYIVTTSDNQLKRECRKCLKDDCKSCENGFSRTLEGCVKNKQCDEEFYFDFTLMECSKCHYSCETCERIGSQGCTSCKSPRAFSSYLHACLPCCEPGKQPSDSCCNCDIKKEKCLLNAQKGENLDLLADKRQTIMIIVVAVICLIAAAIIGGLVFLIYELTSKRKTQDGKYKLLPKSDEDDADDEDDIPIKGGFPRQSLKA
ncbi:furin-like protease kpc-1 isoform X1 [Mytilus trossulus]|uniref:furin-like protease kpc-1 isoform X1 n=1 Tax=Mytilus trossulus TaxID=6551 RepID=UPI00300713D7